MTTAYDIPPEKHGTQSQGITIKRKRVLRVMKADNLLCNRKVFKPLTTDSNHALRVYPNLAKNLEVNTLN
jgi:hypothetical protein